MDLHLLACEPMLVMRIALHVFLHPRQKFFVHYHSVATTNIVDQDGASVCGYVIAH